MELYSFRLLLSGKLFIWSSILIETLLGKVVLVAGLWFSLLGIFFAILFWLGAFPFEKSVANLIGAPLYVTSFFSLAAFNILFVLEFCHFSYDVSCSESLSVPLAWDSL